VIDNAAATLTAQDPLEGRDGSNTNRSEDEMAKGQLRSNREKKKPKADKNKKKGGQAASPLMPSPVTGKSANGKKF
jgi:hypothetical protein